MGFFVKGGEKNKGRNEKQQAYRVGLDVWDTTGGLGTYQPEWSCVSMFILFPPDKTGKVQNPVKRGIPITWDSIYKWLV